MALSLRPPTSGLLANKPKASSVFFMSAANALHFAGYELARNGGLALFTSARNGFTQPLAIPIAVGFVSPFSVFLLWGYTRMFDRMGPRRSLSLSTAAFATLLVTAGTALHMLDSRIDSSSSDVCQKLSRVILFPLMVFINGFVQFLFTQHWSFLSSVMSEEEGAVWFAPIGGAGSIVSTITAGSISPLVSRVGIPGLLLVSSVCLTACAFCSDAAYRIAEKHNIADLTVRPTTKNKASHDQSLIQRTRTLFARWPVLGVLCLEVVIYQCQTSFLSHLFVTSSKELIPDDRERARFTGNCYAFINLSSGVLQFVVMPVIMARIRSRWLWLGTPSIMLIFGLWMTATTQDRLFVVSAAYAIVKSLEYSLRGVLVEMVYIRLDNESRFIGKEIIGLFASRLGKSSMAIVLAVLTATMPHFEQRIAPTLLVAMMLLWWTASHRLVRILGSTTKSKAS